MPWGLLRFPVPDLCIMYYSSAILCKKVEDHDFIGKYYDSHHYILYKEYIICIPKHLK